MDKQKRVDLATRIFAEQEPAIRALIRQHVTTKDEEDEVYQNLYLSLVSHPPTEPVTNVLAYLATVIHNDIIDAMRRRQSRQRLVSNYAQNQCLEGKEETPDHLVTRAEEAERITGLMGKLLSAREARAVIERYVYGRSVTDIAAHMRVKERTVSRYACVGLRRLRAALLRGEL